jgi:hypothetical protein
MKLEFSGWIFEKYSLSDFIKIRLVGAELFHAGGHTDKYDEANSQFSKFCESV